MKKRNEKKMKFKLNKQKKKERTRQGRGVRCCCWYLGHLRTPTPHSVAKFGVLYRGFVNIIYIYFFVRAHLQVGMYECCGGACMQVSAGVLGCTFVRVCVYIRINTVM